MADDDNDGSDNRPNFDGQDVSKHTTNEDDS
jgi:hypothetical protein